MPRSLPDGSRARTWSAFGAALMLHGIAATITFAPRHPAEPVVTPTEPPFRPTVEVEIDPDWSRSAPSDKEVAREEPTGSRARVARATSGPGGAAAEDRGPADIAPTSSTEGEYSVDPSSATPGPSARVDLGIAPGDWSRWVSPTQPAAETEKPRPAPAPVSTTGGLAEALEAHDQGVGLGPSGTVRSAAHEAAHSDVAPQLGRATFAVTVLRTGVVEVQLTKATSNVDGWQKVAAAMVATLRRKPPSIHPPRNGMRLGIEVVAEERWPNGASTKSEGPSLTVSGPSFRAVDESKEELARRNPAAIPPPGSPVEQPSLKANVDLPGVFLQGKGKVCSYKIGLTPFGIGASGGCDPSNIGAHPQRVVSTRVVSESMF